MEQETRKNFLINTFYFLTVAIGIYVICRFCLSYLMPFIIGGIIAYAVQKPSRYISSRIKIKKSLIASILAVAVFINLAAAVIFIALRLLAFATDIMADSSGFIATLSSAFNSIKNSLNTVLKDMPQEFSAVLNGFLSNSTDKIIISLTDSLSAFTAKLAKFTPQFLLSAVVSAVAASYIAADFVRLLKFTRELLGVRVYGNIIKIKNIFMGSVIKLLKGYLFLMLITFFELFIGLSVLKVRYSLVLALLISVIDLLPVLGTGTALIPWAITELVLGNTSRGIGIIVLYIMIILIRNFAEPKIISKQIGINPLFTLISIFIGLKLLGFFGVIIMPVTLIVVIKYYKEQMEDTSVNNSNTA